MSSKIYSLNTWSAWNCFPVLIDFSGWTAHIKKRNIDQTCLSKFCWDCLPFTYPRFLKMFVFVSNIAELSFSEAFYYPSFTFWLIHLSLFLTGLVIWALTEDYPFLKRHLSLFYLFCVQNVKISPFQLTLWVLLSYSWLFWSTWKLRSRVPSKQASHVYWQC